MPGAEPSEAVPVTMGSPRSLTADLERFSCTHAWFPPHAALQPHIHDRATFGVILGGSFDLTFTNGAMRRRAFECLAGTVFTEPAGETHGNRIAGKGASVLVIQIDPDSIHPTLEPLRRCLLDRVNHFRSERIALRARRLARELSQSDPLRDLAAESLALEMLADAARQDLRWKRSGAWPDWLDRAVDYVRANFREPLRIADVAEVAGVHPSHLASVFSKTHQVNLGTFIRRLRLEWAADQLADSRDPISMIAHSAGFSDQSHLTRAFKAVYGRTPAAFRRAQSGRRTRR